MSSKQKSFITNLTRDAMFGLGTLLTIGSSVANSAPHIYWADTGQEILRADLDGANVIEAIKDGMGNIGDFVIDGRTDEIFWNTDFSIYRSDLDGGKITALFHFPSSAFRGDITIDPYRDHLYFVDGRNNIIYRSNTDGNEVLEVVPARGSPGNASGISDLWIDPVGQKLYWTYDSSLRQTNLDGSQEVVLFETTSPMGDFEIDPDQRKIYWTQSSGINAGSVIRANMDGSQQEVLATGLWFIGGIALDRTQGKMYYSDTWGSGPTNYDSTIRMANLDGSGAQTIINLGPSSGDRPFEVTLDTMIVPEPSTFVQVAVIMISFLGLAQRLDPRRAYFRRHRTTGCSRAIKTV